MTDVLISYRRDDDPHAVDRLFESLKRVLDPYRLFLDIDSIPVGVDFEEHLRQQVSSCRVLLAILGPRWLDIRGDDGKRRLENPADFVRIEIEAALDRGIPVVPVLLDNTSMPKADQLPDSLKPLASRQSWELSRKRFTADVDGLAKRIKQILGGAASSTGQRAAHISVLPHGKHPLYSAAAGTSGRVTDSRPSIAVLPFRKQVASEDEAYFGEGIVDDIIRTLSSIKDLVVIARGSTLGMGGPRVDARAVGRDLDVRYVLSGGVARAG
ncbi:MAG: TIR domain-containing protein, partial [Caulobacteraceae bacterium]|nr:TIR domain-containing protein [Caulobacteraceae bacterium]